MSRVTILEDLLTKLQTITVANGFNTEIGAKASYWEVYPDDYNGPPTVTFFDRDADYEKVNSYYEQTLHLEIQAIAYTTAATKLVDSCNLLDDLTRAVVNSQWSSALLFVRPVSNSKEIEGKGRQAIAVMLNIDVIYREVA